MSEMRYALQVTSGFLAALCKRNEFSERATRVTFTGDYAHFGAVTLGEALDLADAALAKADTEENNDG